MDSVQFLDSGNEGTVRWLSGRMATSMIDLAEPDAVRIRGGASRGFPHLHRFRGALAAILGGRMAEKADRDSRWRRSARVVPTLTQKWLEIGSDALGAGQMGKIG